MPQFLFAFQAPLFSVWRDRPSVGGTLAGLPAGTRPAVLREEPPGRLRWDGHLKLAARGTEVIGPDESCIRRMIEMVCDRHGLSPCTRLSRQLGRRTDDPE